MKNDKLKVWPWNWYGWYGFETESGISPSFNESVDTVSEFPDRERVVNYLRSAPVVQEIQLEPFPRCQYCGVPSRDSLKVLSDGVWVWPGWLAHDVEAHSIVLPDRFHDHIRSSNYLPPERCDVPFERLQYPQYKMPPPRWKRFFKWPIPKK